MLSLTSDFQSDTGCPEPSLRLLAEAGFTHVHWCHQWNTDFLYSADEIRQIRNWLKAFGLQLLDLHGSAGREKCWWSRREYERRAGVELVRNRLRMTAALGADAVVMHIPPASELPADSDGLWPSLRRSLDQLAPDARRYGVRLAVENMSGGNFQAIRRLFADYGPDYLGLCYDSGHGNIGADGLQDLDTVKARLLVLHLHDNDGVQDLHLPPFLGTVDWPRLCRLIAASGYRKCISMESNQHKLPDADKPRFLEMAFSAGRKLATMMEAC